ncbi:MAG: YIP1 family protein [Clostridia bacterium]|nr:YIP1 family protein [Clostridia bacterium]
MNKLRSVLLFVICLIFVLSPVAVAAQPYQTYTYSQSGFAMLSPDAYSPDKEINAEYMGLFDYYPITEITDEMKSKLNDREIKAIEDVNSKNKDLRELKDIRDIFVDKDLNVYIVEASGNRVIALDRYYKVRFVVDYFINDNGVEDTFNNPSGIFVNDKYMYVCDTDANRIAMFDLKGNFYKMIYAPESDLFSESAIYKPVAVAVDQYERIFVVSSTTYEGVIVMDENANFAGFIGAQKVAVSPLEILWRRFQTKEQRAQAEQNISTEFNNITIDQYGFIYVTTSSVDAEKQAEEINDKEGTYAPVKKLNAQGKDVMARNGFHSPAGEVALDNKVSKSADKEKGGVSKIIDAAVGPNGIWSIIDEKRARVYTYDSTGILLFAFGDTGMQLGNLQSIEAITYQGESILLVDKTSCTFTVYKRTEYGSILIDAIANNENRDYAAAATRWEEIMKRNNNFDSAYIGIGKALVREAKYEEAMVYFKSAGDVDSYSAAYAEIRKAWVEKYVWVIPLVIIVICVLFSKLFKYAAKLNKKTQLKVGRKSFKEEFFYVFHLMFHPFDGFWDLKHEYRGSVRAGTVYFILVVLSFFYQSVGTSYIMSGGDEYTSFFTQFISVAIPLALWVVANWCLTTLFDGEGSIKDIYVASTYSLFPLVLTVVPATLFSNVLVKAEMDIVGMIIGVGFVWAGALIFFGMMVTHDYTLFKSIVTSIATIVGMAVIMFIGILFSSLLMKIFNFISNIFIEISYRI